MKKSLLVVFGLLCLTVNAQTQLDYNDEANASYKKADKELNTVYQRIMTKYKSDTEFIKNLKASQLIWIKFRDSELLMKYPEREFGYYGSMHSMCVSEFLEEFTKTRIKTLKQWLDSPEEGDPCSGSIGSMY